jgi:phosphatidylglycerophosphatase A
MADRLAYLVAIWFGCGRVPRAPGTAGSIGAVPLYLAIAPGGPAAVLAAAAAVTALGVWAAGRVARSTGTHDPQIVCVDEAAGVLIALAPAPRAWAPVLAAVVLFRVFDVWKPWPARAAERLPGGWGIMMDDVVAGAYAAALVLGARALGWLA